MDRQILNFTANEQILVCDNPIKISTNKVNYIEAHFDLGQNWSGYDSVRAVWFNDFQCISTVLDSQGVTFVPFEVMKRKGNVKVDLVGSISEDDVLTDRLTSYPVIAVVVDCNAPITGAETNPITPSQFEQYVAIVRDLVDSVKDIDHIELNDDYTLTIYYSDGTSYTTTSIRGEQGADGNGIATVELNPDYTLTITYTDGTSYTTTSIRGEKGEKGDKGEQGEVSLDELLQNTIIQTNTDTEPYNYRAAPQCGSLEYDEIVGASVGWNQQANISSSSKSTTKNGITATDNRDGSYTLSGTASAFTTIDLVDEKSWSPNHKYIFWGCPPNGSASTYQLRMRGAGGDTADDGKGALWNPGTTTWKGISAVIQEGTTLNNLVFRPNIVDLTLALGSTIADYVYTLEQSTAGSGVAWLKSHFDCFNEYQPYSSGEIKSVEGLEAHEMVGFNIFPSTNTIKGGYNTSIGNTLSTDTPSAIPSGTNPITVESGGSWRYCTFISDELLPNVTYHLHAVVNATSPSAIRSTVYLIDEDYKVLHNYANNTSSFTSKISINTDGRGRRIALMAGSNATNTITVTDMCLHIKGDGSRDNDYEPYIKHTYPLDSSLTLRGIYKMDSNHNLYADGDVYASDGTVTRKYGVRAYQSGDESDPNVVTDKTNTVYKLTTPTTESATPYTNPQNCEQGGTEEYVSDSIIPIGHSTDYPMTLIDTMPKANGTYSMSVTVANGKRTINWT